jgi:hypothetical protein
VLDQLFGPAVQKTDMRVHALHDLTVELQYQTQHAVSRRVLGPEIEVKLRRVASAITASRQLLVQRWSLTPVPALSISSFIARM